VFRRSFALALLLLPLACNAGTSGLDDGDDRPDSGVLDPKDGGTNTPDSGVEPGFAQSEKANLRFKEVLRLTNDMARALELPDAEVCLELGQYDCRFVHNIALGGVEPYELGLVEPTPSTTITTPIAVERLAVHACERRVSADLDSPSAVIFAGIANGTIASLDDAAVAGALGSLYEHAVLRPVKESEIEHLKQLYEDIEGLGVDNPARQWAIASCVAVLTSVEALFY
jgi:hypothetical protein